MRKSCQNKPNDFYEEYPVNIEEFLVNPVYSPAQRQIRPKIAEMLIDFFNGDYNEALIIAGIGSGKTEIKGTKVLMYDGSIKKIENICIGDFVMGDDSTKRKVISTHCGKDLMYKIIPTKGEVKIVTEKHTLSLKRTCKGVIAKNGRKDKKAGNIVNIEVKDYLKLSKKMKGILKLWRTGVSFKKQKINIDPYFLGIWLGDGNSHNIGITTIDKKIKEYIYKVANSNKLGVTVNQNKNRTCSTFIITSKTYLGGKTRNILLEKFKEAHLLNNKHIPLNYKVNSEEIRLKVLAGLIDSDGYQGNNCLEFSNKNKQLCEDVLFLCRSLGFGAYLKERYTNCKGKKFKSYRISISGDLEKIPVLLKRKKCKKRKQKKNVLMTGFEVELYGIGEYYGIETNGNNLYLWDDFTVTHNSFFSSKAIEYLTYQLLCLKNPQKMYNLADDTSIYLVNVSTNREQAKKVVFGEIKTRIDHSPWFQMYHKPSDKIKSELRFDKNISIFPIGSNEEAPLGYNIFAGVLDEASFHTRTKTKDYAESSHNQMTKRIKSRFLNAGKTFIITSPRFVYDFAETKFEEDKSPGLYKKRISTWEAIPESQYSGETFDLGEFFSEYEGQQIPIEYYTEFQKNPELTLRDLGAIPSLAIQAFFRNPEIVFKNSNKKRRVPFDGVTLHKWFKCINTSPRFIHLDLGLGQKGGDVAGFAMGKFDGWHEIRNPVTKKLERRPKIFIDLVRMFEAKPGQEIQFSEIREFIYELRERGFNIRIISADSWQSKDTLQILQKSGYNVKTLSVDRDTEAYTYMKEAILEKRMDYYPFAKFIQECKYLELIQSKKIDHPIGKSKDCADAVAGVCFHCVKSAGGIGVVIAGGNGPRIVQEEIKS